MDPDRGWPLLAAARWLLVGTIPLASAAAASALQLACRQASAAGVALALDVNWRPTFWDASADPASGPGPEAIAAMRPLLEQAALIKCAREEAEWLFGSADAAVVSAALPQRPAVVVSDGGAPLSWCLGGHSGDSYGACVEWSVSWGLLLMGLAASGLRLA